MDTTFIKDFFLENKHKITLIFAGFVAMYRAIDYAVQAGAGVIALFPLLFLIPFILGLYSSDDRASCHEFFGFVAEIFGSLDEWKAAFGFFLLVPVLSTYLSNEQNCDKVYNKIVQFWQNTGLM